MSQIQDAIRNEEDSDGLVIMPYDESHATASVAQQLKRQVEPTPTTSSDDEDSPGGVIRRTNEFRSQLGPTMLESVALSGMELSKAIERRARDLYRNKFPLLVPAFEGKCEECGAEFDEEDVATCDVCGSDTIREPDRRQRVEAKRFFESVNKEGQSLQELYQSLALDGGRLGGWVHLVRYNYGVINGTVTRTPIELVRADQKRLKPVVDDDGRIGGKWWACPIHREKETSPGQCEKCDAPLREVFFAEMKSPRKDDVEQLYFEDEVIDYAAFNERLSGHDWLSPVEHLWKRQAILVWMNSYAAAFFDDKNTDRYPGRLLILHTTNRDAVEKQLKQAQDERDQDPYADGVLYNEIPRNGTSGSGGDAQVIDLMNEDLLGQSPQLKDDFKSDIRSVYGQVDVQDSELEDAGGLNNEGLQLSVRDDYLASEHQSLKDGPLQKLMHVLGFDDWRIRFVPVDEPEEPPEPSDVVQAAATAEQAGISYAIEDGQFRLADTEGVVDPEPNPEAGEPGGGGGPAMFGDDRDGIDIGIARQQIRSALESLDGPDAVDGARWIAQAYDGMFVDENSVAQQERAPVFSDESDVPDFAEELLGDAIEGGAVVQPDALSNAEHRQYEAILERNLVEEGNWSIDSIQQDIEYTFGVDEDTARTWAVNGVQNVVQPAIQLGYMIDGDLDERQFYLGGPEHPDICDACQELLEETNPDHGGEPRPMDEFNDLVSQTAAEHGIDPDVATGGAIHINCIHRLSEDRDARE